MLKMKDAFKRIGPSDKARRKDTPSPCQTAETFLNSVNGGSTFTNSMSENALAAINEMEGDVLCKKSISNSVSLPQIEQARKYSDTSVPNVPLRKKTPSRKNSATRARSAEDVVALVNMETTLEEEPEKRSHRRGGNNKRNRSKRSQIAQSYEPNKLLEKAIEEGYADLVESLITSGQVNINKLNGFGFAPLHMAAFEGNLDVVKVLIEQGAYIDIQTNTGMSALEIAVIEGNFDCAQLLISHGADQSFVLDGPLSTRCSKEY